MAQANAIEAKANKALAAVGLTPFYNGWLNPANLPPSLGMGAIAVVNYLGIANLFFQLIFFLLMNQPRTTVCVCLCNINKVISNYD